MIRLQKFLDRNIGPVLVNICNILSRKRSLYETKKILVIRLWGIGDAVVLQPMMQGLRKSFPNAQIDVLIMKRTAEVFQMSPFINNIVMFGAGLISKFNEYDLIIDTEPYLNISALCAWYLGKFRVGFSHATRSKLYNTKVDFSKKQHMVQNNMDLIRAIGIDHDADKLIKLESPESDRSRVDEFFRNKGVSNRDIIIGIAPGVAETAKEREWPAQKFAALADKILENTKAKILIIDSKGNIPVVNNMLNAMKRKDRIINAAGMFNVKQLFHAISRCKLFVANDAGPMHIAAAQGVKTIGLFGPNTPVLWAPYGKGNISIYKPPTSGPFIDNITGILPQLTESQKHCMDQITVDEVFNAVKRLMK